MNKNYLILVILIIIFFTSGISQARSEFKLVYVIQQGDTLSEIANDYGVSVEAILRTNNILKNQWIRVGQELIIPFASEKPKPEWQLSFFKDKKKTRENLAFNINSNYSVRINPNQKLPVVNIPKDKIITYHVAPGDTLYDLARSFNTSIGVIMALNKMEDSIIRVGERIDLPINNLTPRQILSKIVNERDVELLARAIHGEARGEPFIGQIAVGAVIINRVLSSYFPDTFYDVIYQKGQFSAVADGQIKLEPNKTAYRAAREAIKGTDPTMGSMYYYNPKTAKNQWWFKKRRLMVTIGDHVFTK